MDEARAYGAGIGSALRVVSAPWLRHFTSHKYAGFLEYGGSYEGLYTVVPWLGLTQPPTKQDMAAAPLKPLPLAVRTRPKSGFSIPVNAWLGNAGDGLRGWARMLVGESVRAC